MRPRLSNHLQNYNVNRVNGRERKSFCVHATSNDVGRIFIRILDTVKEIDTNQKSALNTTSLSLSLTLSVNVYVQRMKDRMDAEKGLTLSRVCIDNNISNDNEWIHELLKLMLLSKGKGILCCGLHGIRNDDISRDPNGGS